MNKLLLISLLLLALPNGRTAMFFNGTSSDCGYNSVESINITNSITIACWLMHRSSGSGDPDFQCILSKGKVVFGPTCVYMIRKASATLQFLYTDPSAGIHAWQTDSTFTWTNLIRHVAFTYTYGTDTSAKMYIDGDAVSGTWVSGNGKSNVVANNVNVLHIGQPAAQSSAGGILCANFSECALWNTILDAGQIKALYRMRMKRGPLQFSPTNLVFLAEWEDMHDGDNNPTTSPHYDISPKRNIGFTADGTGIGDFMSYTPNE